jgi:type IV pilus assembly protein PilX
MHSHPRKQRGIALVIGLILLVIITLLAVVGMNMSNSELASATSEQLRLRAFQAAETGVEHGLQDVIDGTLVGTSSFTPVVEAAVDVPGSPVNPNTGFAQDRYQTTLQYRDSGTFSPNSSAGFEAFHYTVVSTGTSARNAVAQHTQGAFMVRANVSGGP